MNNEDKRTKKGLVGSKGKKPPRRRKMIEWIGKLEKEGGEERVKGREGSKGFLKSSE